MNLSDSIVTVDDIVFKYNLKIVDRKPSFGELYLGQRKGHAVLLNFIAERENFYVPFAGYCYDSHECFVIDSEKIGKLKDTETLMVNYKTEGVSIETLFLPILREILNREYGEPIIDDYNRISFIFIDKDEEYYELITKGFGTPSNSTTLSSKDRIFVRKESVVFNERQ